MKLHFESLNDSHDYSDFDCGNEALNQFLNKRAMCEEAQRLSKTRVAIDEKGEIVGFYTIAPSVITKDSLANPEGRGVPYADVPAIRIGRLAVHKMHQGSGIGRTILREALQNCLRLSNELGGRVVIVDAKNQQAASFYARYGFKAIKQNRLILVLKISTIEKSLLLHAGRS
jgi:GNAT superfamily N-acetyltransferase